MCETESRLKKYKPDISRATGRDICPEDAITLSDNPSIRAKGKYREILDDYVPSEVAERHTERYDIDSFVEADSIAYACKVALESEPETPERTKKAIHRVRAEAKEIARGLKAAVDELETTPDYPESRRPVHTEPRNRGFDASRILTDGGREFCEVCRETRKVGRSDTGPGILCSVCGSKIREATGREKIRTDGGYKHVQETFGRAELREASGKCNKIVRIEAGEAVVCSNRAKWAVEAGGKVERRCGIHKSDIEVLL